MGRTAASLDPHGTLCDARAGAGSIYADTKGHARSGSAQEGHSVGLGETPLGEWSRDEYISQPNKLVEPIPVSFYFDPQTTASTLYIWPTPSAATATDMTLKLTYLRRMDDFDNTNDDADLPQEWLQALVWNLANDLEPEYPVNDPALPRKSKTGLQCFWGS